MIESRDCMEDLIVSSTFRAGEPENKFHALITGLHAIEQPCIELLSSYQTTWWTSSQNATDHQRLLLGWCWWYLQLQLNICYWLIQPYRPFNN